MSEQITSAMLDELERLIAATDPNLYDKWTRHEQLEAHGAYYRRSLELMLALIAAARRAERYEVALRELRELLIHADSMLSLLRHRGGIRRWGELGMPELYEVDHLVGQLRSSYERRIPAALTPEPPKQENAQ